jgi:Cdc6-like AAA superfamily ATPase
VHPAAHARGFPEITIQKPSSDLLSFFTSKQQEHHHFQFDDIYHGECDQAEVFGDLVVPLLEQCLSGINCTLFAYGQTGSGKSYTMGTLSSKVSDEAHAGVIPRSVKYLFEQLTEKCNEAISAGRVTPQVTTSCSYLELYNEEIRDLLCAGKLSHIQIREDNKNSIIVMGAKEPVVSSADGEFAMFIRRIHTCRGHGIPKTGQQAA